MIKVSSRIYRPARHFVLTYRSFVVTTVHVLQAALATYLAFLLRFEGVIPAEKVSLMVSYLPYLMVIRLLFYYNSRLYRDLWRYSSISNLIKIVTTVTLGSVVFFVLVRFLIQDHSYPRSIYILDWMFLILLSGGTRLAMRILREYMQSEPAGKRVLIIGAGDAAEMMVRDMKNNPQYAYEPIGFIDDNIYKKGLSIHGVPIFGSMGVLEEVVNKHGPEEILIAMPSAGSKATRKVYEACKPFNMPVKTLPGMSDILRGKVSISQIKPLSMEDLLQREPVRSEIRSVREFIQGKAVLVTGAGGSIGSELSRQIIKYGPSRLVMLDRYENGLYQVDLELRQAGHSVGVHSVIGDVMDKGRLQYVFYKYRPRIVFHAAAHKHVPLMELNPVEAVRNNVFGTKNVIEHSMLHDVENFVMISTDKAVNPANVMGATKRMAELLALNAGRSSNTKFTTVRFGNVLGSNGSVLHIFNEQLSRGGPLTVTHPDIRRFFMLIPEAVQLVLMASSLGKGGEIFVLDMGEPIKILDFAENLIRLSGFVPYEDIDIEFTGLRPGEKMYEELFDDSEKVVLTGNEKLRIAVPTLPSSEEMKRYMSELELIVHNGDKEGINPKLKEIISGYNPSDSSYDAPRKEGIRPEGPVSR
jgi:FlaA1/EpsC-like NDP-sugar epimerase